MKKRYNPFWKNNSTFDYFSAVDYVDYDIECSAAISCFTRPKSMPYVSNYTCVDSFDYPHCSYGVTRSKTTPLGRGRFVCVAQPNSNSLIVPGSRFTVIDLNLEENEGSNFLQPSLDEILHNLFFWPNLGPRLAKIFGSNVVIFQES